MKARCPLNKVWYYFFNKCLPFGSSVSCAHFQAFSDAIAHVMYVKTGKDPVNYLNDFLFLALLKWFCNHQLYVFLKICAQIQFPVSLEKTFWASTLITFLGMLIDTEKRVVSIPRDKIEKTVVMIEKLLLKKKRKATVIMIQQICGLLNFLCRAITPGRAFTMRLYSSLMGYNKILKPHHHVKLPSDAIMDLRIWLTFLRSPLAYS